MAITVKKLIKGSAENYKMELVAGAGGLNNLVEWAHIVEDIDVSLFLHGQEIVFTVGIMNTEDDWLLRFAKNLYSVGVSAFVVNLGPHTQKLSKEVIAYCDEVGLPLFTIPWEIRLVDVTRDFCHKIVSSDTLEASAATTVKNLIFKVGDRETQILQMERYGYRRDSRFWFVCISLDETEPEKYESSMNELKKSAEKIARSIYDLYLAFVYQENLILVLSEYTEEEISQFSAELKKAALRKKLYSRVHAGISAASTGLEEPDKNFQDALLTCRLAAKRQVFLLRYEELDVYKLLMSVEDRRVLQDYYDQTLAKLEDYDRRNGTDLMGLLRVYLDNNASPQMVSEKQFIHRNTVNNQLRKISQIVGIDLGDLEGKVKYTIALYIADIL